MLTGAKRREWGNGMTVHNHYDHSAIPYVSENIFRQDEHQKPIYVDYCYLFLGA